MTMDVTNVVFFEPLIQAHPPRGVWKHLGGGGFFDGSRFLDLSAIREMPARDLEEPTNDTVTAVLDCRTGTDN